MRKSLASGFGFAAALVVVFGSGTAGAVNEYAGLTYEKAAARAGGGAIIGTRVGEYLPTAQCIVTGSRNVQRSGGRYVLLDLNCNDPMTAGHAGYSAATPQGKEAQSLRAWGEKISKNFAAATAAGEQTWCEINKEKCASACDRSGTCSAEVLEFLGM